MSFATISIADSPIDPRPRWGHGAPPNPTLFARLNAGKAEYASLLDRFQAFRPLLHTIAQEEPDETSPHWNQPWFSTLDAASLVAMMGLHRPVRYVEIGSGNSTKFARFAVRSLSLSTHITSIDPMPRASIDPLCDAVIRKRLQDCDLSVFQELRRGDILFFDGSHRIFQNSDVVVFFLEILPRLRDGVVVHVHDIFLPQDYPPAWIHAFYSEHYIVAAMLLAATPPVRVTLPNHFCYHDPDLLKQIESLFAPCNGSRGIDVRYANHDNTPPVSFWFETNFGNG